MRKLGKYEERLQRARAPASALPSDVLQRLKHEYGAFFAKARDVQAQPESWWPWAPWPEWCWAPHVLIGLAAASSHPEIFGSESAGGISGGTARIRRHTPVLSAILTWSVTQGVYEFDETLYEACLATGFDQDKPVPIDVLFHLPEWCVYVSTPTLSHCWVDSNGVTKTAATPGFFAYLDYTPPEVERDAGVSEDFPCATLSVLVLMADMGTLSASIPLLPDASIEKSLEALTARLSKVSEASERLGVPRYNSPDAAWVSSLLRDRLPLLLYLCARNRDLVGPGGAETPQRPRTYRDRHGRLRTEIPAQARQWNVGSRIGPLLRGAPAVGRKLGDGESEREGPRPHVRRAHWHTYLVGPRGSQRRELRWLHPVLVGGEGVIPVLRGVPEAQ